MAARSWETDLTIEAMPLIMSNICRSPTRLAQVYYGLTRLQLFEAFLPVLTVSRNRNRLVKHASVMMTMDRMSLQVDLAVDLGCAMDTLR